MVVLLSLFLFTLGCSQHVSKADMHKSTNAYQVNANNIWNPDTEKLDEFALDETNYVSLDHDVTNFYDLLHKKEWKYTYNLRWKTFMEDSTQTTYLDLAQQEGARWELSNYEILSVTKYGEPMPLLFVNSLNCLAHSLHTQ
jgi:hypothetical protein